MNDNNMYVPGGCVPPLVTTFPNSVPSTTAAPTNPNFIPFIPSENPRTYIAFILDKSGSMEFVRDATIDAFNKQIETIVKESRISDNNFYSLVTFSTTVEPVFFNRKNGYIEHLSRKNYQPNGWTALYDAIGYTINRLDYEAEDVANAAFLINIVSDGQENRSLSFNKQSIGNLIRLKQNTGRWTFTYLGSNQDLAQVSASLFIPYQNTLTFDSNTAKGISNAFAANSKGLKCYLTSRRVGETSSESFYVTPTTTGDQTT